MSELTLYNWNKEKDIKRVNSVPKGAPVFVYGKACGKGNDLKETDASNEYFMMREMGFAEEEQDFEDTLDYYKGRGKELNNEEDITKLRIYDIKELNKDLIEFVLSKVHKIYWRSFDKGIVSTINLNEVIDLVIPAAVKLRQAIYTGIDKKYNPKLSLANIKNTQEQLDVELNQALGKNVKDMSSVKGKGKKK